MDIYFRAKAVLVGSYTNLKIGDYVYGYYVKCRKHHYILQDYNDAGYDERWETHEWIEIDFNTLESWSLGEIGRRPTASETVENNR